MHVLYKKYSMQNITLYATHQHTVPKDRRGVTKPVFLLVTVCLKCLRNFFPFHGVNAGE